MECGARVHSQYGKYGKCTSENFCKSRFAHLITILTLKRKVCRECERLGERSGGCIEKGENLISCDLGTQ